MRLRGLFLILIASSLTSTLSHAGLMHPDYDLQIYRDFAENRGKFAAGATDVIIYFKDGTKAGVIPRIMSFESVTDGGFAALTGGPQFVASVAHNGGYNDVSFTKRFGGNDFYRVIKKNNGWGEKTEYTYDVQVARLDKLVTEVDYTYYMEDEGQLAGLEGTLVLRAGGGTQKKAITNDSSEDIAGAYQFLTGGTVKFHKVIVNPPSNNEEHPASFYKAYQFQYNLRVEKDPSYPLPIGVLGGDSGSPTWAFNTKNKRWEFIGPGQSGGGGGFSQMRGANAWCIAVTKSYDLPSINLSGKLPVLWNGTDESSTGTLTQGKRSWEYKGLPKGKRFSDASLDDLEGTRNLIIKGQNLNISLTAPVELGSGTVTFHGSATLSSEDKNNSLCLGGFIIPQNSTLTSTLTAQEGDEWRKIGKGTLVIEGKGDNPIHLNIGEGNVILKRKNGAACTQALLVSGRGKITLGENDQLSSPVSFGVRGGLLDLNGHNLTWKTIPHIDTGAIIGNGSPNSSSTFTYTGDGIYLGQFMDSPKGTLTVIYSPSEDKSEWILQGDISNKGGIQIKKGKVTFKGAPTLHANKFVDPGDWRIAKLNTGKSPISLSEGTSFTIGEHSHTNATFTLKKGACLTVSSNAYFQGKATLLEGSIYAVSPESAGAGKRSLDIKGTITFSPSIPKDADYTKSISIDLGTPVRNITKELPGLIKISDPSAPSTGKWQLGVTTSGILRAIWTPSK